jgi:hypothetical protein
MLCETASPALSQALHCTSASGFDDRQLFVFLAQKHKERTAVQLRNAGEELLKQRLT